MNGQINLIPSLIILVVGGLIGYLLRFIYGRNKLISSEAKAEKVLREAKEEAQRLIKKSEAESKEMLLEVKEAIIKEKKEHEKEIKQKQNELANYERRILNKEENLERRIVNLEEKEVVLTEKENYIKIKNNELEKKSANIEKELEKIAGLTKDEAKQKLEEKAKVEVDDIIHEYYTRKMEETEIKADKEAREIIVSVMERIAPEVSKEVNITNITLPDDEMKGRIIG